MSILDIYKIKIINMFFDLLCCFFYSCWKLKIRIEFIFNINSQLHKHQKSFFLFICNVKIGKKKLNYLNYMNR